MAGRTRRGRWLAGATVVGLSAFLSGSYCSYRGYYVPGGAGAASGPTTIGPVSAFASIFVDGDEFGTGSAAITMDGGAASEPALRIGQVATVTGVPGGSATKIATNSRLAGPVTAINLSAGTVTILGQTVLITGDTVVGAGVAPTDVGGLALGATVLVDGYRTATGLIASRFDLVSVTQAARVGGVVAQLDGLHQTFTLAGTTVNFATLGTLPAGVTTGSYLIASGSVQSAALTPTLTATQLAPMTESPAGGNGAAGIVHGAITRFASLADFDVAGQPATTTASTSYVEGAASSLAADVEVEVAGTYDASGRLDASSIHIAPAAVVRVVGPVSALDASVATITVAGITLATDAHTRWDDRGVLQLRTFAFANLAVGDWVEVRGVATGSRAATAHVLERRVQPATGLVELQDVAAAIASPSLTLTGVGVNGHAAILTDVNGQLLTLATFFNLAPGRVVRATGTLAADGSLVAQTLALRQ